MDGLWNCPVGSYWTNMLKPHWMSLPWSNLDNIHFWGGSDSPDGSTGHLDMAAHWLPFIFWDLNYTAIAYFHLFFKKKLVIQKMIVYMCAFNLLSFIMMGLKEKNNPISFNNVTSITLWTWHIHNMENIFYGKVPYS